MKIHEAKFLKSGAKLEHYPDGDRAEFAFIGRSNVGKSSLINALCHRKTLVKTSPKPGKTQLANFFEIVSEDVNANRVSWYLVDLPGYGYARVSKEKRYDFETLIIDYLTQRESLTHIFVLIDVRLSPQQIDVEFVQWLAGTGRPYTLVFTKSDKATQKDIALNTKAFIQQLINLQLDIPQYVITSALKAGSTKGLEEIIVRSINH